ncbi:MAG: transporter substrate-binding domain-containing protein [Hyphomicrobiales bacterium]|nr:transporter substrate-binding domain-containing protein [Hyphomicrobiales bacterium]
MAWRAARFVHWALLTFALATAPVVLAQTSVPEPGKSKKIDEIKKRGVLRAAAIGEFPWLPENTSGTGPQFSGPAWLLANSIAERLGVKLEIVPVSHETKVPILATGQADITIAPLTITPARQKVVDFVPYSGSSLCFFGLASNPKLQKAKTVDDLDNPDITMAYFTGTPPETWAPTRFKQLKYRAVTGSGANAPVEEIISKRADIAPIDNVAWPNLNVSVKGLTVFPKGDDCLKSKEMEAKTAMAIDKGDPVFLAWLTSVEQEMQPKLEAEELGILKSVKAPSQ